MEDVLQLGPIEVGQLVRCDYLDIGQEIRWIVLGVGDPRLYLAAGHSDLVDQFSVLNYKWMLRETPQNIDGSAGDVVVIPFGAEQIASLHNAPTGVVFLERALKRAQ